MRILKFGYDDAAFCWWIHQDFGGYSQTYDSMSSRIDYVLAEFIVLSLYLAEFIVAEIMRPSSEEIHLEYTRDEWRRA